ncbi:conjugal transfer protein TraX [Candidatus Fukatsuia symbiotica]|uniref:Conjugal transfer protein TraX n=1 Tax=Candidatus Fukatsuia symbiotica TaxID=1878942 RepID=A0A2U8I990_9GAMM|nr:conjugal transfer protein TraX [Candidatus Fukatsuia symbiotica]AWK15485.1 conjugal transfer protein TraX [Candidatus Fukatsuia symbiotica]AWK15722.1 conjugal transfer protein TraX [Candidatus Fukatsuia symbiotica]MEA9445871.1 conjugal transfer protein TraX [Candidatus Fukatsuia symbiotica]MEA9446086.1 conjugal transfer protein TraX [Candidatus Fukatsuia symbiotica]
MDKAQPVIPASRSTRWLKGSYYFFNILLPLSETRRIAAVSARPWRTLLNRIQGLCPKKSAAKSVTTSLDWTQAVRASGQTPDQLNKYYLASKKRWGFVLFIPILLIGILMAMLLLNAATLPLIVWIKASLLSLTLLSVSAWGFTRALLCEYRRWQVRERRVSPLERGEFGYFLAETAWIKKTLKSL